MNYKNFVSMYKKISNGNLINKIVQTWCKCYGDFYNQQPNHHAIFSSGMIKRINFKDKHIEVIYSSYCAGVEKTASFNVMPQWLSMDVKSLKKEFTKICAKSEKY